MMIVEEFRSNTKEKTPSLDDSFDNLSDLSTSFNEHSNDVDPSDESREFVPGGHDDLKLSCHSQISNRRQGRPRDDLRHSDHNGMEKRRRERQKRSSSKSRRSERHRGTGKTRRSSRSPRRVESTSPILQRRKGGGHTSISPILQRRKELKKSRSQKLRGDSKSPVRKSSSRAEVDRKKITEHLSLENSTRRKLGHCNSVDDLLSSRLSQTSLSPDDQNLLEQSLRRSTNTLLHADALKKLQDSNADVAGSLSRGLDHSSSANGLLSRRSSARGSRRRRSNCYDLGKERSEDGSSSGKLQSGKQLLAQAALNDALKRGIRPSWSGNDLLSKRPSRRALNIAGDSNNATWPESSGNPLDGLTSLSTGFAQSTTPSRGLRRCSSSANYLLAKEKIGNDGCVSKTNNAIWHQAKADFSALLTPSCDISHVSNNALLASLRSGNDGSGNDGSMQNNALNNFDGSETDPYNSQSTWRTSKRSGLVAPSRREQFRRFDSASNVSSQNPDTKGWNSTTDLLREEPLPCGDHTLNGSLHAGANGSSFRIASIGRSNVNFAPGTFTRLNGVDNILLDLKTEKTARSEADNLDTQNDLASLPMAAAADSSSNLATIKALSPPKKNISTFTKLASMAPTFFAGRKEPVAESKNVPYHPGTRKFESSLNERVAEVVGKPRFKSNAELHDSTKFLNLSRPKSSWELSA